MDNVIKRRKTSDYAQIHNNPLQGGLKDLRAVGLLAHIMSLPEDWTLYKTQLYTEYSRRNVEAGWKELAEKNYVIGFYAHVSGKKKYFYNVSDIPFNQDEFEEFVIEQIKELQEQGETVMNTNTISYSNLVITEKISDVLNVQQNKNADSSEDFSDVRSVQYTTNCTESAYTKEKDNKEINTNKHLKPFVNKEAVNNDEIIHKLTNEYRQKGLSKAVCLRVVEEARQKENVKNFGGYLRTCLEGTLHKSLVKRGLKDPGEKLTQVAENSEVPFYNWLQE